MPTNNWIKKIKLGRETFDFVDEGYVHDGVI